MATGFSLSNSNFPQLLSVGLAVPERKYSQLEIASLLGVKGEKALRFFTNEHIKTRHLCDFDRAAETNNSGLLEKFKKNGVKMARAAASEALAKAKIGIEQVDFLCCVTTTGFIVPTLSVLVADDLGIKTSCERLDIVGMGCSAGLNGMSAVARWAQTHPDQYGILICCEVNSAIYVNDDSENSALVNSLFGDGVAAAVLTSRSTASAPGPRFLKFASYRIPTAQNLLRFDWNSKKNLYQFYVGKDTPARLGENIEDALSNLFAGEVRKSDIKHWIFHSGGAAILDKISERLMLEPNSLRHTRSVLRDYGNISSGSFLFTYNELLKEGAARPGDLGVMVTMGPGLAIETALLKW